MYVGRSARKASLTEAGKIFCERAEQLCSAQKELISALEPYRGLEKKSLRIGTLPFLTQYHLTATLREFAAAHPRITLQVEEVEEKELMQGLNRQRYDLVFARSLLLEGTDYKSRPLAEDELIAVLSPDHPLAARDCLEPADIAEEDFILMNPYTAVYRHCMALFAQYDIEPHILRTARVETILSSVALGDAVTLLPRSNFEIFQAGQLRLLSFREPMRLYVCAGWLTRRPLTAAMKCFLGFAGLK